MDSHHYSGNNWTCEKCREWLSQSIYPLEGCSNKNCKFFNPRWPGDSRTIYFKTDENGKQYIDREHGAKMEKTETDRRLERIIDSLDKITARLRKIDKLLGQFGGDKKLAEQIDEEFKNGNIVL